jgi:hypothetical protein
MKATLLVRNRIIFAESAFADLVVWKFTAPVAGSNHQFKYRLAYVVEGICVVRYDNERGKGDHRHFADKESPYAFINPEKLVSDFQKDIMRWNHENRRS